MKMDDYFRMKMMKNSILLNKVVIMSILKKVVNSKKKMNILKNILFLINFLLINNCLIIKETVLIKNFNF
jgi:hypothetical protein